ncbi:tetraspanin-10 [Ambystoma mexicanum]|uniref:tetraspanin-10 n=1 Tax=Ambystoma mexicanum TaxID=8296 RepID=UPI0037E714DA
MLAMKRAWSGFWTRLSLLVPAVQRDEGSTEVSRLLPKASQIEDPPVSYLSEGPFEKCSGNDLETKDVLHASDSQEVLQASDTKSKTPFTAYDVLEGNPEKWYLLHHEQLSLGTFNPGNCCAKYILFFSNFMFSVLGLLILGVGVWGLIDKESLIRERIQHLGTDPMLLVVLVGLGMTAVSVAGCMGSLRENSCLLRFFTLAVVAFVVLQVLAGIMLYALRALITDSVGSAMRLAIVRYQDDVDMKFIIDEIQLGLECCGEESYRDWKLNLYFNCSSPGANACGVPFSCCIDPLQNGTVANSQCGFGALRAEEMAAQNFVYLGGCVPQLVRWVSSNTGLLGTAAAILLVLEVMCLLLACRVLEDIEQIKSQW